MEMVIVWCLLALQTGWLGGLTYLLWKLGDKLQITGAGLIVTMQQHNALNQEVMEFAELVSKDMAELELQVLKEDSPLLEREKGTKEIH